MELRIEEPLSVQDALQMNSLQLAYIGDTVWELLIRQHLVMQKMNVHHMHNLCVNAVNARAQASNLNTIASILDETESEIVRRGRNAHSRHPAPRNQNPMDYALATGFEALLGFLYITGNEQRIIDLYQFICREEYDSGRTETSEG